LVVSETKNNSERRFSKEVGGKKSSEMSAVHFSSFVRRNLKPYVGLAMLASWLFEFPACRFD